MFIKTSTDYDIELVHPHSHAIDISLVNTDITHSSPNQTQSNILAPLTSRAPLTRFQIIHLLPNSHIYHFYIFPSILSLSHTSLRIIHNHTFDNSPPQNYQNLQIPSSPIFTFFFFISSFCLFLNHPSTPHPPHLSRMALHNAKVTPELPNYTSSPLWLKTKTTPGHTHFLHLQSC